MRKSLMACTMCVPQAMMACSVSSSCSMPQGSPRRWSLAPSHWAKPGSSSVTGATFTHTVLLGMHNAAAAWVGIEYMAQAIAAWAGNRARLKGQAVKVGLLLGTRRYAVHRQAFVVGDCLRIEARCELMGDNGLGMFACRILDGDEEIAVANVSVYEPPDPDAYLGKTNE